MALPTLARWRTSNTLTFNRGRISSNAVKLRFWVIMAIWVVVGRGKSAFELPTFRSDQQQFPFPIPYRASSTVPGRLTDQEVRLRLEVRALIHSKYPRCINRKDERPRSGNRSNR